MSEEKAIAKPKPISLMGLEWRWSLLNLVWQVPTALVSFALPAWAVGATQVFDSLAPFSWVAAGFLGMGFASGTIALAGWGRGKWIRSRYDARMLPRSGRLDPLDKTFERQRIYLHDFALPSHPLIEDKTFIDCEIIGPANVIFDSANNVNNHRLPVSDAVVMHTSANPFNGYIFRNCTFRGCNFVRLTLLVPIAQYGAFRHVDWLNWITPYPDGEDQIRLPLPPNQDEAPEPQLPAGTEEETPQ